MLLGQSMKAILLCALLAATASTSAGADPRTSETTELRQAEDNLHVARTELAAARIRWDAAVAGEHPNPAGRWARQHLAAMQQVKLAERRWQAAKAQRESGSIASRTR